MLFEKWISKAQEFVSEKTNENIETVKTEMKTQVVNALPTITGICIATVIFAALYKVNRSATISSTPSAITIINNNFYSTTRELGNDISSLTETICDVANKMIEASIKKGA